MNVNSLSATGASLEDETDEDVLSTLDEEDVEETLDETLLEVLSSLVVDDVLTLSSMLEVDSTVLVDVLSIFVLVLAVELQAIKKVALTSNKTFANFIMMVFPFLYCFDYFIKTPNPL